MMNPLFTTLTKTHIIITYTPRLLTNSTTTETLFFIITTTTIVFMITPSSRSSFHTTLLTRETITTYKQIQIILIYILQTSLMEITLTTITCTNLISITRRDIQRYSTHFTNLTITTTPTSSHLRSNSTICTCTIYMITFTTIYTEYH